MWLWTSFLECTLRFLHFIPGCLIYMQVCSQQGDHINIKTHSLKLEKVEKGKLSHANLFKSMAMDTSSYLATNLYPQFQPQEHKPCKKHQVLLNVFSKEIFRDVTGREIRIENFSDQSNFCLLEVIRFPVRNQNVQHNFDLQASFFTSTQKT